LSTVTWQSASPPYSMRSGPLRWFIPGKPGAAGGAQGAALGLVDQCQAEMHPLIAFALRAASVQHVRIVDPAARGLAPREPESHARAGNELARLLVGQGLVPPDPAGVEERQRPQPPVLPF